MKTYFALLCLCEGNPTVTGGFPSQRPVWRSFDVLFDLRLNNWLGKQSRRRRFETASNSLWRHCNETIDLYFLPFLNTYKAEEVHKKYRSFFFNSSWIIVLTRLSSVIPSTLSTRRVKGGYGVKHIWKLCINTHLADRSSGTDSLVSITHEKHRQLFKPLYGFALLARDGDDNEHIFSYTNMWPASVHHIWL